MLLRFRNAGASEAIIFKIPGVAYAAEALQEMAGVVYVNNASVLI